MGLLRPATPLSIIFFVAFVLLLLSTLSTPVIHAIPLGTYQGWNFGVFGYCKGNQCSGYKIGYSTDGLFTGNDAGNFELPSSTRHSLSAILIVHPIAAFLTLICFGLAVAAHFHSPAHSPRYLLALLILTIPTLLVTLLAFLVDILLFVPHMQWGGWIVLAATILIIASTVVTCAMRRTLVSRKARKKRIAENADMSGANYYDNLHNQNRLMADELPKADSPPPLSGSTAGDKPGLAQYATYEMKRQDTRDGAGSADGGIMNGMHDDRTPLNPTRDPSIRSASTGGGQRRPYGAEDAPPMPMGRQSLDSNGMAPRRPSRDQYGNLVAPAAALGVIGAAGVAGEHHLRHQGSQSSLGSNSNRAGGFQRGGRAGYGPPGRGGYGPPRGGYGPPGRGSYGPPRGSYRGQGAPPPGWRGRGGYGPPPAGMMRGGMRNGPPPGYAGRSQQDPYWGSMPPPRSGQSPTMESPQGQALPMHDEFVAGPIGQAIEMDERTGSPPGQQPISPVHGQSTSPLRHEVVSPYGLRDSDGDVAGMVGLQQGRDREEPHRMNSDVSRGSGARSPNSEGSVYSDHTYVPPRAQWAQAPPLHQHQPGTFLANDSSSSQGPLPSSGALPLSPIQASPPTPHSTSMGQQRMPQHARNPSENYYEDVDPRFAVDPASDVGSNGGDHAGPLPSALTPGGYGNSYGQRMQPQDPTHLQAPPPQSRSNIPSYVSGSLEGSGGETDKDHSTPSLERGQTGSTEGVDTRDHSYESLPTGARSPGEGSDTSHFTSVSQRPVNPNWRPGPGSAYGGANTMGGGAGAPSSASAAQRRREDVILNANPDFALPGMSPMGRGRGRGGRGGMGMGRVGSPMAPSTGLTPSGRYPTDI